MAASKITTAIVRGVPNSFVNAISKATPKVPICIDTTRLQHAQYIKALLSLDINVIELPADEEYPDCIFVEDNCVIIGEKVLMANSGAQSRRGETQAMEDQLHQLGFKNIMYTKDIPGATMDGGDVLVTPRHVFAGQSQRTNARGIDALRLAFKDQVTSVNPIAVGSLHLKCVCTWAGDNRLLITENEEGLAVRDAIRSITDSELKPDNSFSYEFIPVPIESEANVVYANGTLLVPTERTHTQRVLQHRGLPFITVPSGEISKADGSTTCCSVLFSV